MARINYDAASTPRMLDRDQACTIASHWHSDMFDPIYAFSSTGKIQSEEHRTRTRLSIMDAMAWICDHWDGLLEPNSHTDIQDLADLLIYVQNAPIENIVTEAAHAETKH